MDLLLMCSMATRNTACRWRHWRGGVGLAGLTLALAVVFGSGDVLRGAESVASNAASSNAVPASLEYKETDQSIITWSAGMAMQTTPFKKEPAAATGKSLRGVLNFFGDASNAIPFLWQEDAGKLYLDLNRNQDMTDDPDGVFKTPAVKPVFAQTFTNVHLVFNTAAGKSRLLADITLYDYGSMRICNLAVRSFWQGKLTLQGRDWQAGLVQKTVNGQFDRWDSLENCRLLLRAWEKRDQPFNANDGSLTTVPFSRKLFVDGRAYQVDWTMGSKEGEAKPALQFTEQTAPLGELKITGQFIRRLVLPGGPYLVILDEPAGGVKIPTGSYDQPNIQLEEKGTVAFCDSRLSLVGGRIAVDGKTTAVLKAGGPLTNSLTASRQGQDLVLDYHLVGAGGETYQLAKQDATKPPTFAIYKNDKKIASGDFEFG